MNPDVQPVRIVPKPPTKAQRISALVNRVGCLLCGLVALVALALCLLAWWGSFAAGF